MDYWIGDGHYAYVTDQGPEWLVIYSSKDNMQYVEDLFLNVSERDASEYPRELLEFEVSDSVFMYRGQEAYMVRGRDDASVFESIYSVRQYFDPAPFANHKFANWNEELKHTKGSLLLYSRRSSEGDTVVMEYQQIKPLALTTSDFKPDRFRKKWQSRNQSLINELKQMQSEQPLSVNFQSIQVSGEMSQENINFPFALTTMDPSYMKLQLDVMNTSLLIFMDGSHTVTYNPFENTAVRTKSESGNTTGNIFKKVFREEIVPEGVQAIYVNDLEIDSLQVRRVLLASEGLTEARFYDLKTGLMKLSISLESIEWYLGYKMFGEHIFPSRILSVDEGLFFRIDELAFDLPIDNTYFELPDSLSHLLRDESAEMSAEEYYNLAEKQAGYVSNMDSLNAAIRNYKLAIEKAPDSDLYYNQLGNAYYYQEDFFSALVNYKIATEKNPQNYIPWQNLASVKYQLEKYESALEDINRAIALNNKDSDNFDWRGEIYYALDEPGKARADLEEAFRLNPKDAGVASKLGILLYGMDSYDSGLYYMDKAAELGGLDGDDINYHGLLYFSLDRFDEALAKFEHVIREFPEVTIAEYNRAYTLASMGRREEAIQAYEQMLASDSTNAEVMDNLGMLYYENSDYAAAVPHFKRAISVVDNEAIYFDHLGNSYYHLMKFKDAISAYDKSINLYPDDPQIYYNRGMSKIRLSDKFDGCKDLKAAMDLGLEEAEEQFQETCSFLPAE